MEKKNDYCVIKMSRNRARVSTMRVYYVYRTVAPGSDEFLAVGVTKEEAHVLIRIAGMEDVTGKWGIDSIFQP